MPREYYVYPNGTSIAVAGNNEYATQIPMSVSDTTDVYTAISAKANSSDLATVATTGNYADLSNTPSLATVATSGSYTDLSNKPTNTLKVELGSGAGSGSVFTFPTGGSTNGSWLVSWGGAYVGFVTIFSTTVTITKIAGSTALTATATISDNIITITMSSVPWANLRYVKLFA